MQTKTRRHLLTAAMAAGLGAWVAPALAKPGRYICPPCGCAADGRRFDQPGLCPSCGMTLVLAPDAASTPFEPRKLEAGAGRFEMTAGRAGGRLVVHYYRPATFTPDSPILIILAGAGRNADTYRDAWITEADRAGILIAAPAYPEDAYDIAAYQMGGIIKDLIIDNMPAGSAAHVHLRDEDIRFSVNPDTDQWIFRDFDRLFDLLKAQTGSRRQGYDLFGHSAGGQIAHRHVLFHPQSRADRIVAANAGLYTLPDLERPPLLGMAGTGVSTGGLKASLEQKLIILAGENDTNQYNGGSLLHTPLIDATGADRMDRARYFYKFAETVARRLEAKLAWSFGIVANTGHDFRAMSAAAARILYRM